MTQPLSQLGIVVDERRGAANFHVLRHLAQTVCKNERFPLARELQAVRALRCASCSLFVGFRHEEALTGGSRDYVHHQFLELVDGSGNVVTWEGRVVQEMEEVGCAGTGCVQVLFDRADVLPWSHVLSSTRLTDMDAYLEWEHSWSGDSAGQPAFFVKRLREGAAVVRNERVEHMRQGVMEVGDVFCSRCDKQVGWKFLKEIVDGREDVFHNYDQVGRFGIIRTAVSPVEQRFA